MRLGGILLLSLLQGLTEFLPVSSSGHLVIGSTLFGFHEPSLLLDVLLHVGTLLPVVWLYRRELLGMIRATIRLGELRRGLGEDGDLRLLACVCLGTVPTAAIGGLFADRFEQLFSNPTAVGWAMLCTGAILLATLARRTSSEGLASLTPVKALVVGFTQALAIIPGISRSGATIAAGMLLDVERETAARFSFLLSVPAILGATALHLRRATLEEAILSFGAGALVAALTGYLALRVVVRFVRQGRLHWFAAYVLPLGLGVLIFSGLLGPDPT